MIRISVLIPTRGRPDGLRKAVRTLHENADKPEEIEYLLRTDDDQPSVFFAQWRYGHHIQEYCGVRVGYGRIHEMYNFLASHAQGELLFNWNDDAEMLTKGWDSLILSKLDDKRLSRPLVQFIRRDTLEHADTTFPFTDRRIFQAVGRLSGHCNTDTWLADVSATAGVRVFRDDIVFHHHRLTDAVMTDNQAAVKVEHPKYEGMQTERDIDARKIRDLLEKLKETP